MMTGAKKNLAEMEVEIKQLSGELERVKGEIREKRARADSLGYEELENKRSLRSQVFDLELEQESIEVSLSGLMDRAYPLQKAAGMREAEALYQKAMDALDAGWSDPKFGIDRVAGYVKACFRAYPLIVAKREELQRASQDYVAVCNRWHEKPKRIVLEDGRDDISKYTGASLPRVTPGGFEEFLGSMITYWTGRSVDPKGPPPKQIWRWE